MTERRYKLTTGSSLIVDGNSLAIRMHEDGETFEMPVDEVEVFNDVLALVDEKDAIIKKFEDDAMYWYRETEKARSMFLAAHDDKVSLRKALEEARQADKVAKKAIDDMGKVINQKGARICELEEQLTAALGEGDQNGI
ncbi:hypothetical protein D3C74_412500 [compost metagenome]